MQFLVMIEGRGFRTDFGDGPVRVGFYANRLVEASDASSIDERALFNLASDELLANKVARTKDSRMRVAKVTEFVRSTAGNYSGFSFFEEGTLVSRWMRSIRRRLFNSGKQSG